METVHYYDSDQMYPLYGFAGKIAGAKHTSKCFALNGDILRPEVNGTENVLKAYDAALSKVMKSGPSTLASVVRKVVDQAEAEKVTQKNQAYKIHLVFTDGGIDDIQDVADQIVRGSEQPLSIVIIGVGDGDFSHMDYLDADKTALYSQVLKRSMSRDIVQFVPFRKFKSDLSEFAA